MTKDAKVVIVIYLATLGILLYYNLAHPPVNDGVKEYESYLLNIKQVVAILVLLLVVLKIYKKKY